MTQAPTFQVEREDGADKGRYVVRAEGAEAEMTYTRAGVLQIIIEHTGVPDALRGTGAGQAMVEQAVQDARAGGYKIIPLCPFAKAQFDKHPEWADVRSGA